MQINLTDRRIDSIFPTVAGTLGSRPKKSNEPYVTEQSGFSVLGTIEFSARAREALSRFNVSDGAIPKLERGNAESFNKQVIRRLVEGGLSRLSRGTRELARDLTELSTMCLERTQAKSGLMSLNQSTPELRPSPGTFHCDGFLNCQDAVYSEAVRFLLTIEGNEATEYMQAESIRQDPKAYATVLSYLNTFCDPVRMRAREFQLPIDYTFDELSRQLDEELSRLGGMKRISPGELVAHNCAVPGLSFSDTSSLAWPALHREPQCTARRTLFLFQEVR